VTRLAGLVSLALSLLPCAARGVYELGSGDLRAELEGHVRVLGTFTREEEAERFLESGSTRRSDSGLLLTRARITARAAFAERLYGQVSYDMELRTGSALDSLAFALGEEIGTRTWLDADRTFLDNPDAHMRHALYRAWVRYEGERFDLTAGRQRIALGQGRLWNPTDLFNPIFPLDVEGDQRIGQDAAVARVRLSKQLRLAGIWSPQDDPDEHRWAARLELDRKEVDGGLMVGSFQRDWVFGADFAASVAGAAVRGEATLTDLRSGGRIWQVVGSVDRNFPLGSGLYVLVEHLYNENLVDPGLAGASLLAALEGLVLDRITTLVRNQTGLEVGYDLTPLLRADLLVLYDWHGPSVATVPSLRYSFRPDVEIALGAQLFLGPHARSEYGDRSNLLILQIDAFF
jgi:hypothetical protein